MRNWAAPLLLLAFTGNTVKYVNVLFTSTTRWFFLLFVFLCVVSDRFVLPMLRMYPLRISLVYALWAMLTCFWSESPLLSIMKAFALFLIIYSATGIGFIWATKSSLKNALDAMLPLVLIILCAGLLGLDTIGENNAPEGLIMYQGLAGNPNMWGSLCAMILPFTLWKYENMVKHKHRLFWGGVCIFLVVNTVISNSRAAMMVMVATVIGLNWVKFKSKKNASFKIAALISVLILLFVSQPFVTSLKTIISKGNDDKSLTSSRDFVWEESYAQAVKGGLFGGGCGVTIGTETVFDPGLSASNYGREKGNTQLAVIEEMGLIGLFFYLFSTFGIVRAVWKRWRICRNTYERTLQGLIMGLLIGLFCNSIFEAWYVAPASPESVYYWFVVGISLGLINKDVPHDHSI